MSIDDYVLDPECGGIAGGRGSEGYGRSIQKYRESCGEIVLFHSECGAKCDCWEEFGHLRTRDETVRMKSVWLAEKKIDDHPQATHFFDHHQHRRRVHCVSTAVLNRSTECFGE